MAAILEIPEVRQRMSPLSVKEYHQLGEFNERGHRTELIRGFVIEKMSKSPLHATTGSLLYDLLSPKLPPGYCIRKEEPLTFADSEPEPDISVVRGSRLDFIALHPSTAELVVEVAVSSAALDRENTSLYAEAGVKEYWIVLAATRSVEVYRWPENGVYREKTLIEPDGVLTCASVPPLTVRLAELFASSQNPE